MEQLFQVGLWVRARLRRASSWLVLGALVLLTVAPQGVLPTARPDATPPVLAVAELEPGAVPRLSQGGVVGLGAHQRLEVAVSPWLAWRLGHSVLADAEAVFNQADGSGVSVSLQPTAAWLASPVRMTGAGMQVARCGRTHGLASVETTAADGWAVVTGGRIRVCGEALRLDHDRRVALVVHEVAHLLGLGHVCEGRGCEQACSHLMAGQFRHDCAIDTDSLDAVLAQWYPAG